MTWIPVKTLPLSHDLTELSRFLHQRGLVHRITDERTEQKIWVQDPALVEPLAQLTERWLNGDVELPKAGETPRILANTPSPKQFPVTLVVLLLSVLGALVGMDIVGGQWISHLTFQSVTINHNGLQFGDWGETMAQGEIWRLLTPAFLHFSFFHILFNGLWLWELGRRLEALLGSAHYVAFVVGTAIAANVAQYLGGPSVFGGMSGVVYALIGFIWMRQKFSPHPYLAVPSGIIGFMLVWLVICMTGIVDRFIGGAIANGAHVGGLVGGMAWGILTSRSGPERQR